MKKKRKITGNEPMFGWKQWRKQREELKALEKKINDTQYVYLMQSENGLFKIGISKDPRKRLAQIRTGSGVEVELVAFYLTDGPARDVEKKLHKLFDKYRLLGEWFKFPETYSLEKFETLCDRFGMTKQGFKLNNKGIIEYEWETLKVENDLGMSTKETTQQWIERMNREWEESKKKND